MTLKSRRIILFLCFLLFFAVSPFIILYTAGYRWTRDFKLYKTGGLYISSPLSGSKIYVNGKEEKETSFFRNYLFMQSLLPGQYSVLVVKDGYWLWSKKLSVKEEFVTETEPLLLPKDTKGKIILKENYSPLEFSKYEEILNVLNGLKKPLSSKATQQEQDDRYTRLSSNGKEKIWWDPKQNRLWAEWLGDFVSLPYYFCDNNGCSTKILIYSSKTPIKNAEFYPQRKDAVVIATQNGIYAVEIDGRGGRNIEPVYKGKDPIFTTYKNDNNLYVLDENNLIEINLD
jgi:hypothetical protein